MQTGQDRSTPGSFVSGRLAHGLMVCVLLQAAVLPTARAHESEQYTLPAGRDFADLGPQLSREFAAAIKAAVADTNAAIDAALAAGDRPRQVQALQAPSQVAGQVWARLFATYPANETLDLSLLAPATRSQYPGLVTMYRPVESVYDDPLLMLDLSKPVRAFFRAGTVSAGGVLFGTDKIIHFINLGRIYHTRYLAAVDQGLSEADATQHAVQATSANPLLSEEGFLGLYTTGIRSNGDLAADFAGLKFYRNLTEPVHIGAVLLPPMLQREGPYWRMTLQDEDRLFTRFVSAHWNEVLNPNSYLAYVGARMRSVVAGRCDDVTDWFRDARGQPLPTAWFAARQQQLSSYFGEPYGHQLPVEGLVSVAALCPAHTAGGSVEAALWWGGALPAPQAELLGRSALWQAAADGHVDEVERLAAAGMPLDEPDIDGDTALHAAVRRGQVHTVRLLLQRGADVNRGTQQGKSPLGLAVAGGQVELSGLLLQAGADVNAQDRFGRTALHEAAERGDVALASLLLRHGADATLASRHGADALQLARRAGRDALLLTLRASASVVRQLGAAGGPALASSLPEAAPGAEVPGAPQH
jgi:ankyrin repeat protein